MISTELQDTLIKNFKSLIQWQPDKQSIQESTDSPGHLLLADRSPTSTSLLSGLSALNPFADEFATEKQLITLQIDNLLTYVNQEIQKIKQNDNGATLQQTYQHRNLLMGLHFLLRTVDSAVLGSISNKMKAEQSDSYHDQINTFIHDCLHKLHCTISEVCKLSYNIMVSTHHVGNVSYDNKSVKITAKFFTGILSLPFPRIEYFLEAEGSPSPQTIAKFTAELDITGIAKQSNTQQAVIMGNYFTLRPDQTLTVNHLGIKITLDHKEITDEKLAHILYQLPIELMFDNFEVEYAVINNLKPEQELLAYANGYCTDDAMRANRVNDQKVIEARNNNQYLAHTKAPDTMLYAKLRVRTSKQDCTSVKSVFLPGETDKKSWGEIMMQQNYLKADHGKLPSLWGLKSSFFEEKPVSFVTMRYTTLDVLDSIGNVDRLITIGQTQMMPTSQIVIPGVLLSPEKSLDDIIVVLPTSAGEEQKETVEDAISTLTTSLPSVPT